jgi:hypothetical protein
MQLSMEIPKAILEQLSPLCDLDFALAQEVLQDAEYTAFYLKQRKAGRFVLLDNGFHELGRPLSSTELLLAASKCDPSAVVAPDWLGDPTTTYNAFFELLSANRNRYRMGFVLCGKTGAERASIFTKVAPHTHVLCLPFKEPRFEWFQDLVDRIPATFKWPARIHLLGVSSLRELTAFRELFLQLGISATRTSVDTGKPVKFGIIAKQLHDKLPLRGNGALNHDYKGFTDKQLSTIHYNIAFLRKYM